MEKTRTDSVGRSQEKSGLVPILTERIIRETGVSQNDACHYQRSSQQII